MPESFSLNNGYDLFWAIAKNGYTRSGISRKRVNSKTKSKTHPTSHLLIVVKSISYPFTSPFLRDHDPQVHLPDRYTCRTGTLAGLIIYLTCRGSVWMAQVRLGSGLGRIRVSKPRKSSVVASVCCIHALSVCLFYALYYQQR